MSVRPGIGLLWIGAAMTVLALLTFWWPGVATWLVFPLAILALAGLARDYGSLRQGFEQLSVHRHAPAVVGRGQPFRVALQVTNGDSRAWDATLRDGVPSGADPDTWIVPVRLPQGGMVELQNEFRFAERGPYVFDSVWVRLQGPGRLLEGQRRLPCDTKLRVYPEQYVRYTELHKESADELRLLDQIRHSRQRGTGTEFESLSEFREGDDPRRVDWRATARCRRPIVRRFQVERHRDVIILVDCGRLMGGSVGDGTKLDRAIDAALMLGRIALLSGDRCGLGIFDDRVRGYLPPQGGRRAISILTDSLYSLHSEFRESDFSLMFATLQARQRKRGLVIVLSDINDEDTSTRYRSSLARLAQRHVVLFAALRTPALRNLQHAPVHSLLDGYRTAVAFRILRERERAVYSLKHSGVHVLDVEPNQLTVPLINQYIDLRQRNLV